LNERYRFALADVRGKIGQSVTRRRVMLPIVQAGQRTRTERTHTVGQCWLAHDSIDLLAVQPDVTPPLP
jgi:hypothetical protein